MSYASVDDVNASLPDEHGVVVKADDTNIAKIQISVERMIRGYLSRVVTAAEMALWTDPDHTPEIIREIAAMLTAAQLYFNKSAGTSLDIDERNFAQLLYDKAMALLNGIIEGTILIPGTPVDPVGEMTGLDFWPVDDTNRAFSMDLKF